MKIFILKTIGKVMKKLGRGSSIVGFIDEKYKLNVLKNVDFTKCKIIYVIGTNGKTSITNTINKMYLNSGQKVLSNLEGANLTSGIKTSVIMNLKNGKIDADVLLLEVDEKTVINLAPILPPQEIIITNFFRDQLDRYYEIDLIIEQIMQIIKINKPKVYYNSQDPLLEEYFQSMDVPKVTYKLQTPSDIQKEPLGIVEMKYCPNCHNKLKYDYYHIGHIGAFECSKCGFKPSLANYIVTFKNNTLGVKDNSSQKTYEFKLKEIEEPKYMIINYALIVAFAIDKFTKEEIDKTLKTIQMPKGRNNIFQKNNQSVYLNLAKNVVGMEQTIQYLINQNKKINLIIAFNDNHADGKDVSWIWDTNFALLIPHLNSLHLCGTRKGDMNLRFLYEDYENIKTYESIDTCLEQIFIDKDFVIITNYTPLSKIYSIIEQKMNS